MIFVTVGNATQEFRRLLDAVESLKGSGHLKNEPVFIQTGNNTNFHSGFCECKTFLSMDEFQQWMEKVDLIISHGGCGTLMNAIRLGKKPIVMPRRKKYGEHVNDHQVQLVQALASEGRVIPAYEPEDLPAAILEARKRQTSGMRGVEKKSPMLGLVAKAFEELIGEKK